MEQNAQGEGGLLAGRVGCPDKQGFNIGRRAVDHFLGDFADDAFLSLLVPMLAQDAHCARRRDHGNILYLSGKGHVIEPIGNVRCKSIFIFLVIIGFIKRRPTIAIALLLGSRGVALNLPVLRVWLIFPIFYGELLDGKPFGVILLILRNLAVVAILVWSNMQLMKLGKKQLALK